MQRTLGGALLLHVALGGCASRAAPPPPQVVAPAPPAQTHAAAPTAPAPEPSPEEKKRADDLRQLEEDYAKLQQEHDRELQRFRPELREAAKRLAETAYPSGRAAILAALASPHRKPGHAERDSQRHPLETLEFFGFKPSFSVLEYGPGEGWYTEILAPALARRGKLAVNMTDPNGPREERATFYGQRTALLLDRAPEIFGKVERIGVDPKAPHLEHENAFDLVLVIRGLHGMVNNGVLDPWLAEIHEALKPAGVLGVVQHRAASGKTVEETSKQGYLPEAWVIEKLEAAGFKLLAKSEINANPKDTKDHPEGVWTLPPILRLKDRDREKYVAIGESDRMTLKFGKVPGRRAR